MIQRFITPSSPVVQISGSEGDPPPVKMTLRTTSRWPRRANLTLKAEGSALEVVEV